VVAVCAGNICRSPIAEAVLQRACDDAGLDVEVTSAGTGGWHVGEDAHPRTRRVLAEHGYELSHTARQFDPAWLEQADLVLALDAANLADLRRTAGQHGRDHAHVRLLRSLDPDLAGLPDSAPELEVPDPYYGPYEGYLLVLGMVEAAAPGLVELVRSEQGG